MQEQARFDVSLQAVPDLVAKLRRIPASARRFSIGRQDAQRRYRIPEPLLVALLDAGLPSRRVDGEVHFDRHDVVNVCIHLGVGPMSRAARRSWPAALTAAHEAPIRYRLRYQADCPEPRHDGPCRFDVTLPGPTARQVVTTPAAGLRLDVDVPLQDGWPAVPDELAARLGTLDEFEFMRLPPSLQRDLTFIQDSGLVDCVGVSELVAQRAAGVGAVARRSFGVIAAPPYANLHYWAELLVDDRWVPVDPVLVGAMTCWGVLDAATWPPYRSIGPLVVRVADDQVLLATHNGGDVQVALPSRWISGRPAS
ncbi:hypothetical protein [Micromonospora sp. C95]|uniref:hypothetical protein n=1 Tax=Micromonospora sp. C95 TaxID=2824882 RepID=UPI001B39167B|nr:hypothetical protein [Micromonospora sp. C95]